MLKIIFLFLISNRAFSLSIKNSVVYGKDDRFLVNSSMDKRYVDLVDRIAPSIALMIDLNDLRRGKLLDSKEGKESIQEVIAPSLAHEKNLCSSEKFRDVPVLGTCTGFLVGEDLLLTAGHCIKGPISCQRKKWLFDYRQEMMNIVDYKFESPISKLKNIENSEVELPPKNNKYFKMQFPVNNIVGCKEIIRRIDDSDNKIDFALIRLDRKVIGRQPLKYRKTGRLPDDAKVLAFGHPWGMPLTIAPVGNIRSNNQDYFFTTNTDTFRGNSGSPVINAETLEVEGLLVRGEDDAITFKEGEGDNSFVCKKVKVCDEGSCDGEDATRITSIPDLILSPEILKVLRLSESFIQSQVESTHTFSPPSISTPSESIEREVEILPPLTSGQEVTLEQINEVLFSLRPPVGILEK